jgi:hypothetical protein
MLTLRDIYDKHKISPLLMAVDMLDAMEGKPTTYLLPDEVLFCENAIGPQTKMMAMFYRVCEEYRELCRDLRKAYYKA